MAVLVFGAEMNQTKLGSLIETSVNIAIGFVVALASQIVIFPMVGIHGVSFMANLEITAYFTVVSVIRGYMLRRWFNARLHKASLDLAGRVS
jgi:hypothetical protein